MKYLWKDSPERRHERTVCKPPPPWIVHDTPGKNAADLLPNMKAKHARVAIRKYTDKVVDSTAWREVFTMQTTPFQPHSLHHYRCLFRYRFLSCTLVGIYFNNYQFDSWTGKSILRSKISGDTIHYSSIAIGYFFIQKLRKVTLNRIE